jgi:hypothetical protein
MSIHIANKASIGTLNFLKIDWNIVIDVLSNFTN